jgi:pectinesterase
VNDSLPNGYLGTGIVIDPRILVRSTEDSVQYLIVANSNAGSSFTYYAGAGWTRSGDFENVDDWNGYLATQGRLLKEPLKISVTTIR